MDFNNFKYSKKHDTFRTLINVYNFNKEQIEVYVRSDYKIIVTDDTLEEILDIPNRIKLSSILCHYVDNNKTLLMIELKLKDLEITVNWKNEQI